MIIHVFLAKDRLYNAVAVEMKTEKALFPQSYPDDLIRRHVNVVVDTLWYIDGAKHKYVERSNSHNVKPLPKRPAKYLETVNFSGIKI